MNPEVFLLFHLQIFFPPNNLLKGESNSCQYFILKNQKGLPATICDILATMIAPTAFFLPKTHQWQIETELL